jgi:hypothetical protein
MEKSAFAVWQIFHVVKNQSQYVLCGFLRELTTNLHIFGDFLLFLQYICVVLPPFHLVAGQRTLQPALWNRNYIFHSSGSDF